MRKINDGLTNGQRYRQRHKSQIRTRQQQWVKDNREQHQKHVRKYIRSKVAFLKCVREQSCTDCGLEFPWYIMEFDHARGLIGKYGNRNRRQMSQVAANLSWSRLFKEIDKCDVVCANCHKARTYFRREAPYVIDNDGRPTLSKELEVAA